MRGGTFRDGFLGGIAGHGAAGLGLRPNAADGFDMGRVAIAAVVGGTVSVIGGGKFANGARSAAMVYLFNELNHQTNLSRAYKNLREAVDLLKTNPGEAINKMSDEEFLVWYKLEQGTDISGFNISFIKAHTVDGFRYGSMNAIGTRISGFISSLGYEIADTVMTGYTLKILKMTKIYGAAEFYALNSAGSEAINLYDTIRDSYENESNR